MKISHLLYKVNHLERAMEKFKKKGFKVEYGSKTKPHNALIYFSEGPYIELLEKAPLSLFAKIILTLIGQTKVVQRLQSWEMAEEGFFELCLENQQTHFKREEQIFKAYGQDYFITKSNRRDIYNRQLTWRLLFPLEKELPFLMTYFNLDPKPKNFIHPNGAIRIKQVSFGIETKFIPIIKELCDDTILEFSKGKRIGKVLFEEVKMTKKGSNSTITI
ncbi:MAG: VOC family protein [Flavobacteriaceae bacterium]